MADILMWFLLVVGLLIVFISYWLVSVALFPGMVERAREAYAHPFKSLGVGLVTALPIIALGIGIAAKSSPAIKLLGLTIAATPILVGLLGSAGLSQRIGIGMASPVDLAQPWRRVLRGGIVLSFAFLLPFIGWFAVLPLTLVSGFGAAILSLRRKAGRATPPAGTDDLPGADRIPLTETEGELAR